MQFLDLNIPTAYIPGIPVPPNMVSVTGVVFILRLEYILCCPERYTQEDVFKLK